MEEHACEMASSSFSSSALRQLSKPTRGWLERAITQPLVGCLGQGVKEEEGGRSHLKVDHSPKVSSRQF